MTGIFIAGADDDALQDVNATLVACGAIPARSAQHGEKLDLKFWHQQVLERSTKSDVVQPQTIQPSRLWDQLASEIFIANIEFKVWSWADTRVTWVLDYWVSFEPRLKFLLIVNSPQFSIAKAMLGHSEFASADAIMKKWHAYHEEILRFYYRNSERCLLVDAEDCARHAPALVDVCRRHLELDLLAPTNTVAETPPSSALAKYLAAELSRHYPQSISLQHEIVAASTRLGAGAVHQSEECAAVLADALEDYRSLVNTAAGQGQLHQLSTRLEAQLSLSAELQQEKQLLQGQLDLAQEELKRNAQERQKLQSQLDLAHQDQQALKKVATREKGKQDALRIALEAEIAENRKALEAAEEVKVPLQRQLDELQKHAVEQEDLHNANLRALTDRHFVALEQLKNDHQVQLQEKQQESELLLSQLHSVQEDLERFFLQLQDTQQMLTASEKRWTQLMQKMPGYCDFESLEILSADVSGRVHWRFENLYVAGLGLPVLELKTQLRNGTVDYLIDRSNETAGLLRRWPCAADDRSTLSIPAVDGDNAAHISFNEVLQQIATSDWRLMQEVTGLLGKALTEPMTINSLEGIDLHGLQLGFENLELSLFSFPDVLRFDSVHLKSEQFNSAYEYLWLELKNVSLGQRQWPAFEFRVACVNLPPQFFGGHPKLEFPDGVGAAPFEAWFEESRDDLGAKLELRFAAPEAMDVDVWQRLSESDRIFLKALLQQLPTILAVLKKSGLSLERSWEDWLLLANDMQRILMLRCAALEAKAMLRVSSLLTELASFEEPARKRAGARRGSRKGDST